MPTSLTMTLLLPSTLGVHKEMTPGVVSWDAFVNSKNVLWRHGAFRVRDGLQAYGDQQSSHRAMGFTAYDTADVEANLVMATDKGMFWFDRSGPSWTDVTEEDNELTAGPTNLPVMRVFECDAHGDGNSSEVATILVNGKDAPKIWDGDPESPYADIGGDCPVAKCAVICGGRLVLGNFASGTSPAAIDFSTYLNPNDGWGPNELILGDTPGPIVAMREMGNLAFNIYKSDALYEGHAVADNSTLNFSLKAAYIAGPVSSLAVVSTSEGLQLYLADDGGIYKYDGVQPVLLGENTREYLAADLDQARKGRSFGVYDSRHSVAYFFYPKIGVDDIRNAVMVDIATMSVWPMQWDNHIISACVEEKIPKGVTLGELSNKKLGELTIALGELMSTYSHMLFGDSSGQCHTDGGAQDGLHPISFSLETGVNDFKVPDSYKTITSSDHLFAPASISQSVSIQIGASSFGEVPAYEDAQTVDIISPGPFELGHRIGGRSLSVKIFGDAAVGVEWKQSRFGVAARGRK